MNERMTAEERTELLAQARDLIAWLEAHPEVPVAKIEARYSVRGESDEAELAELAQISAAAGLPITGMHGEDPSEGDHQYVRHGGWFDFASYQATAIPSANMARHEALYSYSDCVEPEAVAA